MKVVITGDLFLGGDLRWKSASKKIQHRKFVIADLRIVNLEQPISDSSFIEDKSTLYTGSEGLSSLWEMGINAVNLAHNHIQDKGDAGIVETTFHLKSAGIGFFGAGEKLADARKPFWINDNTALLGYCEFDKPYLRQVAIAKKENPGTAPLRYDFVEEDLNKLPEGTKAILFFHWGREHVWFPPYEDIAFAKKLLADERVALIAGSHAHRAQGFIEYKGKRAYMCLGNFLFPNFYIRPPTQICYPENLPENVMTTRQYHSVGEITYKKWKLINRISILLDYDTDNESVSHYFGVQTDEFPVVMELNGFKASVMDVFIRGLSLVYKAPRFIYLPIERTSTFVTYKIWKAKIILFLFRQKGINWFLRKVFSKITFKQH